MGAQSCSSDGEGDQSIGGGVVAAANGSEPPDAGSGVKLSLVPGEVARLPPPTLWASEMAIVLPPVRWISMSLCLAPGRPSVIAGQGGVRKGWLAMGIMFCGAANIRLFDRIDLRPSMRSIYADYEQTVRVTQERFQLLAGGYQVRLASLDQRFGYRWKPVPSWAPMNSERQKTLDALYWHTEGIDLLVVDSLRACAPGIEENSSAASAPLDLATDVSEKTGVGIVFLDHASGKAQDGQRRVDAQRGHSSKKDACQTLLVLTSSKGKPTLVTCERAQVTAEAEWPGDVSFTLERGAGGLRLVEVLPEAPPSRDVLLRTVSEAFLSALRDGNEGCSSREMRALLGLRDIDVASARDFLERRGEIVNRGNSTRPSWYLSSTDMGPF
jgi:hypothetical protein